MESNIKQQLLALAEPEYKKVSKKLLPGTPNILGVRLPHLRKIAAKLAKSDYESYFSSATEDSFEETMLQGMTIGYLQQKPEILFPLIKAFVPKIDNWSVCDSFCSGLKQTKKYPDQMWLFLQPYFNSTQEFELRFGVVMLLYYYITPAYLQKVFQILDRISHPGYYIKMAIAWAVSVCYIKYPTETMYYLKNNHLDSFTYRKSLQKIKESRAVSQEQKQIIQKMMKQN